MVNLQKYPLAIRCTVVHHRTPMHCTPCQRKALHLLERDGNVFLTGAAGTGKSFLLRYFLQNKPAKTYPVLASTGTAALIVNGRTFHSFFGLGILEGGKDATVERALKNGRVMARIAKAECIIIDEISMLSGETIATAEEIARHARCDSASWGGLRVVAVGDFAQLPPVQKDDQPRDWAFLHPVWEATKFTSVYLQTPVRTKEPELLAVLHAIREGTISSEVETFLESRMLDDDSQFEGTRLFPWRNAANAHNRKRLEKLDGKTYEYETVYTGRAPSIEQLKKQCPVEEVLRLKDGALIMMRKNDTSFPYKYVNGTLGTIRSMTNDELYVHLMNGKDITVLRETFSLLDGNGKERASATNFPVTLAWATTIHKAQGASIDRLLVNIRGLWESGHAYVALSRAQSTEGLFIEEWDRESIFIDALVQQFYEAVQYEWKETIRTLPDTQIELKPLAVKDRNGKKIPNYRKTEEMLREGRRIAEIAQALGWKEGTIIQHIEKLLDEDGELPDIEYLRPSADIFSRIAMAFEEYGTDALKPIYEECDGEFSYDEIRLARLFCV